MLKSLSIIAALIALLAYGSVTGFSQASMNGNTISNETNLHQAVLRVEPGCRFDAGCLVLYDIPENAASILVYNVLGQRLFEQNISSQQTTRIAVNIEETGLLFVQLRDANNNSLVVMKAIKR